MKLSLTVTSDGSHTYKAGEYKDLYHSIHGAIQESQYIYIENGIKECRKKIMNVFEMGFGTGLNAFLTLIYGLRNKNLLISYTSIELYPLNKKQVKCLNYPDYFSKDAAKYFMLLHEADWGRSVRILENFTINKIKADMSSYIFDKNYDVVYFDAFCPAAQPELWKEDIFRKIFRNMNSVGILITYSANGKVRRDMASAGFIVNKLKGPPGKKHILQALKKVK